MKREDEKQFFIDLETEKKYVNIQKEISRKIRTSEVNIENELKSSYSFGEKISDKVAKFGGSWRFIIIFTLIILFWILINTTMLKNKPFDPYPFILLNLVLSCLAAIQAPIIMMSQNRQENKDRARAENDYKVNIRAEREVELLNEKIDHLLNEQIKIREEINKLYGESNKTHL
ncbi:MAG: DUF1003 domain-containing protein [Filifactoraceae bacterium]